MMAATPPLRYLALGDSYTIGEAVAPANRWPAVLIRHLRDAGVAIDDSQIIAVTGWTTDELAQAMDVATLTPSYDLVSLQIGVNDQYRGRAADTYRQPFAQLLARAVTLAGQRPSQVVVVSIPDWGTTRFAREHGRDAATIADALDSYNAIACQETLRAGAHWADITGVSRQHPDLIADDGLHPSAAQYALWTEVIEPIALQALRSQP